MTTVLSLLNAVDSTAAAVDLGKLFEILASHITFHKLHYTHYMLTT